MRKGIFLLLVISLFFNSANAITGLDNFCYVQGNGECNTTNVANNSLWTKVDISAGDTITFLLINTSINNATTGYALFDFYDDFLGGSLNATNWRSQLGTGVTTFEDGYMILDDGDNSPYGFISQGSFDLSTDYISETRVKHVSSGTNDWFAHGFSDSTVTALQNAPDEVVQLVYDFSNINRVFTDGTSTSTSFTASTDFINHKLVTNATGYAFLDGVLGVRNTEAFAETSGYYYRMLTTDSGTASYYVNVSSVLIRKFNAIEPNYTITKLSETVYQVDITNTDVSDITDFQVKIDGINLTGNVTQAEEGTFNLIETFNTSFNELDNQNITLSINIINLTGTIANITIENIEYETNVFSPNFTSSSSTWANATYILFQGLIPVNNTKNTFNWTYNVSLANGTTQVFTTSSNNQSVYEVVFFNNVTTNNVAEGESFTITSSLNDVLGITTLDVVHEWNQTNYTTLGSYFNTLTAPLVSSDTIFNYTAWINVTYNSVSVIRTLDYKNQTIINFNISTNCSGVNVTYNFTFLEEFTTSYGVADANRSDITVFISVPALSFNTSLSDINVTFFEVCINPNNTNVTANTDVEFSKPNYAIRHQHLRNNFITNQTQNTTLYLINDTLASEVTFTVFDSGSQTLEGAIVIADKNNLGTVYNRVDMGETFSDGRVNLFLEKDVYYNLKVFYLGSIFDLGQKKISSQDITNGVNLFLNPSLELEYLDIINNVVLVSYTNVTTPSNRTSVEIVTVDHSSVTGRFIVIKHQSFTSTTLCDNTTTSDSFAMDCYLGNLEGSISIVFQIVGQEVNVNFVDDELNFKTKLALGGDIPLLISYIGGTISLALVGLGGLSITPTIIILWILNLVGITNIANQTLIGLASIVVMLIIIMEVWNKK